MVDRVKLVAGEDEVPAAQGVIADLNLAGGAHWKPSKISVSMCYLCFTCIYPDVVCFYTRLTRTVYQVLC